MLTTLSGRSEREFNNKVMYKNIFYAERRANINLGGNGERRGPRFGRHLLLHHGRAGGQRLPAMGHADGLRVILDSSLYMKLHMNLKKRVLKTVVNWAG